IVYRRPVKNNPLRVDAQRLKVALDEQRPALSGLIRLRNHQCYSEYSCGCSICMDPCRTGRGESESKKQQCQGSNPGARSASHRENTTTSRRSNVMATVFLSSSDYEY